MTPASFFLTLLAASSAIAAASTNANVEVETRSLDEIYQAALKEGGVVTVAAGGDEKNQQDTLKQAFEARFPGMTLNVTVDLSKYHDGNIDFQIANGDVYTDTAILQTLHDFPRWKQQGLLLPYKPADWDQIYDAFKDPDGAYVGLYIISWLNLYDTDYVQEPIKEFTDYLRPELKDKLVFTYPNDDDAVLFAFKLILEKYGYSWFEQLLTQNPRWVRGTATPSTLIETSNSTYVASFTGTGTYPGTLLYNTSYPSEAQFVTWPQTGAILKDAPHPESAKLLHSYMVSKEYQEAINGWTVRKDVTPTNGLAPIFDVPNTNITAFGDWMMDRAAVERLRFFFEDRLGTAQGLSPLEDDI
ncbi:ABC-type Fe3+ transport system [Daedaleopsis nitida]|nr:ABC-type Fe3+ transport system [Daedaleopsis nitida]